MPASPAPSTGLPRAATIACAVTCGVLVANLYYAQPLVATIAPELGISKGAAGFVVTATQLGYGAGLFLLVPLADRVENRRLILLSLVLTALALAAVAAAPTGALFMVASASLGIVAAGAQVVIPFVAALTPEARRGRAIGDIMAGLLAGIMLSRPVASMTEAAIGWRHGFAAAAAISLVTAIWVRLALPTRQPEATERYPAILRSMGGLVAQSAPLRRRAIYQGLVFAAFNIFWTAAPLELVRRWQFGATGIALFALAGAAGALAAPLAGRLGDRGHVQGGTAGALLTLIAAALVAAVPSLTVMVIAAIALDAATQVNQVLGQRVIHTLPGEARGRINAVYMTIVFLLGAGGSAAATAISSRFGWNGACLTAALLGTATLAWFATEPRRHAAPQPA